jgi:hypothetical protein
MIATHDYPSTWIVFVGKIEYCTTIIIDFRSYHSNILHSRNEIEEEEEEEEG